MNKYVALLVTVSTIVLANNNVLGQVSGEIAIESSLFPKTGSYPEQKGNDISIAAKSEYNAELNHYTSFRSVLFFRYDENDTERTHFDVREMYIEIFAGVWEIRAGIGKVFWGVAESQNIVDIINQTDLVESLTGNKKLGQPMINVTHADFWGVLDFYILPYFRERTFPGSNARFRFPLQIDTDNPIYESSKEEKHIDTAVRWEGSLNAFDIGLSYFYGTARDPVYSFAQGSDGRMTLRPLYHIIHQTGTDIQMVFGNWLIKSEAIFRSGQIDDFIAYTGGFEYTFSNMKNSGSDLGIFAEYLYDNKSSVLPRIFENDTFIGIRLTLNDVNGTEFLGSAIIDNNTGSTFISLDMERRLFEDWKIIIEYIGFANVVQSDFLYNFRRDSNVQVELVKHF